MCGDFKHTEAPMNGRLATLLSPCREFARISGAILAMGLALGCAGFMPENSRVASDMGAEGKGAAGALAEPMIDLDRGATIAKCDSPPISVRVTKFTIPFEVIDRPSQPGPSRGAVQAGSPRIASIDYCQANNQYYVLTELGEVLVLKREQERFIAVVGRYDPLESTRNKLPAEYTPHFCSISCSASGAFFGVLDRHNVDHMHDGTVYLYASGQPAPVVEYRTGIRDATDLLVLDDSLLVLGRSGSMSRLFFSSQSPPVLSGSNRLRVEHLETLHCCQFFLAICIENHEVLCYSHRFGLFAVDFEEKEADLRLSRRLVFHGMPDQTLHVAISRRVSEEGLYFLAFTGTIQSPETRVAKFDLRDGESAWESSFAWEDDQMICWGGDYWASVGDSFTLGDSHTGAVLCRVPVQDVDPLYHSQGHRTMEFDRSGKFLLFGSADGTLVAIRIGD